jgi:hypothetical protein
MVVCGSAWGCCSDQSALHLLSPLAVAESVLPAERTFIRKQPNAHTARPYLAHAEFSTPISVSAVRLLANSGCDMLCTMLRSATGFDWVLFLAAGVLFLYILKYAILSREHLRKVLRNFVLGFIFGFILGSRMQMPKQGTPLSSGIFLGAVAAAFVKAKNQSRHIPARIKRQVIARDFKGREHEYDSRKHHIDHKWAFARGGGHTPDNLRVIEKKKNLKKGAKRPGLFDMFFR